MANRRTSRPRWRRPLVYTIAVLTLTGAGATVVYLRGSAQRRADRSAIVSYERAVLPPIREGGRIVQQEMKPALGEISRGEVSAEDIARRALGWRAGLERALADVLAADTPSFLGSIENEWEEAFRAYLITVDAFDAIARSDPTTWDSSVNRVADLGDRADDLFDEAAGVIQFHRRRLGLEPTGNLPDPSPPADA